MKKFILAIGLILATYLSAKGVEDASGYHLNSNLQLDAALQMIETIFCTGSERILDIGCGDGKITAWIGENLTRGPVVGVDISDSMIRFASAHYPQTNLTFLQADAANLPFQNQFDLVLSFSTLHWVLDQQKALQEIQKALVPGGKAYLVTYGKSPTNISTLGEELVATPKWAPLFPNFTKQRIFYTEEEYRTLLQNSGFAEAQVTAEWAETLYPDRAALIRFIKPLLNYTKHLPQELQHLFAEEIAAKLESAGRPTQDGSIPYRIMKLQVVATKK